MKKGTGKWNDLGSCMLKISVILLSHLTNDLSVKSEFESIYSLSLGSFSFIVLNSYCPFPSRDLFWSFKKYLLVVALIISSSALSPFRALLRPPRLIMPLKKKKLFCCISDHVELHLYCLNITTPLSFSPTRL